MKTMINYEKYQKLSEIMGNPLIKNITKLIITHFH